MSMAGATDLDKEDFPSPSKIPKLSCNNISEPKQMSILKEDRLTALPESLLLHILSFLRSQEALRTGVLSRKWQFLWTDLSEFDFIEYCGNVEIEKVRPFVDWVGKTLGICSGIHLNKFKVSFNYHHAFAFSVNGWVQFLIKNKVRDVILDFDPINSRSHDRYYTLPMLMCYNSSLTKLSLKNCTISGTICWKSLTSLSLSKMDLGVMTSVLSGCPVLDYLELDLSDCWGLSCLDLNNTSSLKRLVLISCHFRQSLQQIIAPYIQHLSVTGLVSMGEGYSGFFRLTDGTSLVTANLDFIYYRGEVDDTDKFINDTKELLESLRHAQELVIGNWYLEVLSILKMKGWKLPLYSCKRLILTASTSAENICCILWLLESSPNIETLDVNWFCPRPSQKAPAALFDLKRDLLHLKIVKFDYSREPYPANDPMPKLVELLLKRARILEKMVINVEEHSEVPADWI